MAGNQNPDFDNFDFPTEGFPAADLDGLPDPLAQSEKSAPAKTPQEAEAAIPTSLEGSDAAPAKRSRQGGWFKTDPYTALLAVSLAAITAAVIALAIQLASYGGCDYRADTIKQVVVPAEFRFVEPVPSRLG